MKTGIELIREERQRQIESEGYDRSHDDEHVDGELARAAGCYIANAVKKVPTDPYLGVNFQVWERPGTGSYSDFKDAWPWHRRFDKTHKHDQLRSLVIAGALIAAEIERVLRLEAERKEV